MGIIRFDKYGKYYFNSGYNYLHREDGPAIESYNGAKLWFQNGEPHRVDGPAIEDYYHFEWLINGKKHREDGPAVIYKSGGEEWWLNGKRLSKEDWEKEVGIKTKVITNVDGIYKFHDRNCKACSIQNSSVATEDCLWLGCDDIQLMEFMNGRKPFWKEVPLEQTKDHGFQANTRMHLTKEMAADLIVVLQKFVNNGVI